MEGTNGTTQHICARRHINNELNYQRSVGIRNLRKENKKGEIVRVGGESCANKKKMLLGFAEGTKDTYTLSIFVVFKKVFVLNILEHITRI
jgi:hypothetical protein